MLGKEYRQIIRKISVNVLNKTVPGLKAGVRKDIADLIAKNVHARMYGANVDGVDSPLWRESGEFTAPDKTANEILKEVENA